jgi:single-stranded-DNA-specific exonuclease
MDKDSLTASLSQLEKPWTLLGIKEAAQIVLAAIQDNKRIVIAGDYDCDGATGTATLYRGLKLFGAKNVSFIVPDRATMGYGLSVGLMDSIKNPLDVGLILTVDNGISAFDGIQYAKSKGWDVVVTDHHLGADTNPLADAIVNPNQKGCPFPYKSTAGVGVAFYLLVAMYGQLSESTAAELLPDLRTLTDLVAVGTIADMVALESNNRILVRYGLKRIEKGLAQEGLKALIKHAQLNLTDGIPLTTQDIGFRIAPLINAVGRMADMTTGIKLLTTDDPEEADILAHELYVCNQERKKTERGTHVEADSEILECMDGVDSHFISLYNPAWHEGIIGLVAGRIKETYKKPTVVLTKNIGGMIKGSCRSVDGVHIRDILAQVNSQHPDIMRNFGGHAMAAGLTLYKEKDIPTFNTAMRDAIKAVWDGKPIGERETDGQLTKADRTLALASDIELFPWGQGVPYPIFDGSFIVVSYKLIKGNHIKFKLKDADGSGYLDCVFFQRGGVEVIPPPDTGSTIQIRYQLIVNRFRSGTPSVEALIEKFDITKGEAHGE